MKTVRILVADDHEVVQAGLCALLEGQAEYEVCGQATTGRDAVAQAKRLKPDVVVLDIAMPELNGLEATRQILKAAPRTEVLILTVHESEQLVRDMLDAGVRGYVLKSDAAQDLVAAVERLRQHKPFFTSRVSEMMLESYVKGGKGHKGEEVRRGRLTAREREIVQLLAEGKSNKEVAVALGISVKTVETHRTNIMHKLDFHSITELVHYAIRNKMVEA